MIKLIEQIISGISYGSLYALLAIGYTMVYGVLRMINFAHGDIFMMSAYFAFFGMTTFALPWYLAFIVTIVLTGLLGVITEKVAYKPLRNADKNSVLISAIGGSFLLSNLATYLFSGRPKNFPDIPFLTKMLPINEQLSVQVISLFIPMMTLVALFVLTYIVNKTKMGMAMRSTSQDYETASVMGVNINNIFSWTFALGSALASIGGMMWAVKYPGLTPTMGVMVGLKCFIAAVIGGIGNITGAVIGGFI
ncbi:MAG: branched-chain amino acid ABC transporter permease, partial [Tissierellia bacterium]|nr:branched-chain amino acid ABC transporter permease [Tissierellia bacterium]